MKIKIIQKIIQKIAQSIKIFLKKNIFIDLSISGLLVLFIKLFVINLIIFLVMCLFGIIDFSLFTFFENLFFKIPEVPEVPEVLEVPKVPEVPEVSKIPEVLEKDKNQVNLNRKYNFFFRQNISNKDIK
jgi:hypothetical protein